MSIEEIEVVKKKAAKSRNGVLGAFWDNHPLEMSRKTVLRVLLTFEIKNDSTMTDDFQKPHDVYLAHPERYIYEGESEEITDHLFEAISEYDGLENNMTNEKEKTDE